MSVHQWFLLSEVVFLFIVRRKIGVLEACSTKIRVVVIVDVFWERWGGGLL